MNDGHWSGEGDYAGLPAESQTALAKYETPLAAVEGCVAAQKKLGSSFRLPDTTEGLTDQQKTELGTKVAGYNLAGVPDSADGYNFTHPEGVEVNPELLAGFKQLAFDGKTPPATAQKYVDFWNTAQAQAKAANEAHQLEVAKEGKKQLDLHGWQDGDMKNVQLLLATYVAKDPASDEGKAKIKALAESMDRTELGNNAPLLLALKGIHADLIAEGRSFESSEQAGQVKQALEYATMEANLAK